MGISRWIVLAALPVVWGCAAILSVLGYDPEQTAKAQENVTRATESAADAAETTSAILDWLLIVLQYGTYVLTYWIAERLPKGTAATLLKAGGRRIGRAANVLRLGKALVAALGRRTKKNSKRKSR